MDVTIRAARAEDAAAIRDLVRSERLNPTDLDWRRFVVADEGGALAGGAQLRPAGRGAVELASLVVRAPLRGQGVGERLVEAALARAWSEDRVLMVTAAANVERFRRWGFLRVGFGQAPGRVRLDYAMGQAATLWNLLRGRAPRRLAILERFAAPGRPRAALPAEDAAQRPRMRGSSASRRP